MIKDSNSTRSDKYIGSKHFDNNSVRLGNAIPAHFQHKNLQVKTKSIARISGKRCYVCGNPIIIEKSADYVLENEPSIFYKRAHIIRSYWVRKDPGNPSQKHICGRRPTI